MQQLGYARSLWIKKKNTLRVVERPRLEARKKRLTKQQLSAGAGSKFSTVPFVQWVAASCRLLQFRRKQLVCLYLNFQHICRKMVSLPARLCVAQTITDASCTIVVYI